MLTKAFAVHYIASRELRKTGRSTMDRPVGSARAGGQAVSDTAASGVCTTKVSDSWKYRSTDSAVCAV
jgi:hypothetical protein